MMKLNKEKLSDVILRLIGRTISDSCATAVSLIGCASFLSEIDVKIVVSCTCVKALISLFTGISKIKERDIT